MGIGTSVLFEGLIIVLTISWLRWPWIPYWLNPCGWLYLGSTKNVLHLSWSNMVVVKMVHSLTLAARPSLKIDGWGSTYFQGKNVSFREDYLFHNSPLIVLIVQSGGSAAVGGWVVFFSSLTLTSSPAKEDVQFVKAKWLLFSWRLHLSVNNLGTLARHYIAAYISAVYWWIYIFDHKTLQQCVYIYRCEVCCSSLYLQKHCSDVMHMRFMDDV